MLFPYLTLKDPRAAMALYEHALGATTEMVMDGPGGSVMHAEMTIADQRIMLSGEWPGFTAAPQDKSPVSFMIQVDDCDAALARAVEAGMTIVMEPENMFWGDRMARVTDGHGYEWSFSQPVEAVAPDELRRRARAFAESMEHS